MNEQACEKCKYFLQHYILIDGSLKKVFCGHCMKNARKRKSPDDKICELFTPGEPAKDKMVSKEFLTKELLHRVLTMELFPESAE